MLLKALFCSVVTRKTFRPVSIGDPQFSTRGQSVLKQNKRRTSPRSRCCCLLQRQQYCGSVMIDTLIRSVDDFHASVGPIRATNGMSPGCFPEHCALPIHGSTVECAGYYDATTAPVHPSGHTLVGLRPSSYLNNP